ncbi:Arylsulfatase [Pontiella desulfatans]|uniref:Arylsulfatase n=2 Tax=Pontiella desulfatans TaxID=2750659 RepID=A0A6C2TVX8_PONDE|nr:sulfatase S1_7 [Kiritimatiellales bacterium]VGO11753.1 Arylsulfatase [Pontiella desulfatans]
MRRLNLVAVFLVSAMVCFGQQPNVLFIAVDDLNDWTGFAGDPNAITPNMDQLAGEGVHFSRAYCAYPLCGPSRASLMSGVYFSELNASATQPEDEEVEEKIEALGSSLLHTYLGNHGYKTMAVGKILHSHVPDFSVDLSGGREGWDFNEDAAGNRIRSNWPPDLNPDTASTLTDWGIYVGDNGTGTEADMSDSIAAAWAVDRLQETHSEPFMLMVGFLHPHVPWYVPQSYYDMYDHENLIMPPYNPDDWDDIPSAGLDNINDGYPRTEWAIANNQWTNMVHAYLANITYADAKIGLVLDALEASPYSTNTIVVLWSDHGYHMGEKNTFQKHTLWDRSGVAPLIIKAPGMATNSTCNRVVSLLDIYPTLLDLCGLPANELNRGQTLRPLLENPALPWDVPAFNYKHGIEAVQVGDLRHIEYEDGSQELYDHSNDPDEWTNLVNDVNYAEIIIALKNMSPFQEEPPSSAKVFEFVDGSALDAAGIGGGMTVGDVTITTLDVIGQDGTRASGGVGHGTNVGTNDGLGINSADSDKANNFDSGEGWEFSFDTDVYLQSIDLLETVAGGTLAISSSSFTDIVISGAQDGASGLGNVFVPSNALIGITFSHTNGPGMDGPKIMSLTVMPPPAASSELFADGFEGGFTPIWASTAYLSSTSYEGAKAAKMNNADYVETGVDTTGYSGIRISYARKTDGLSAGSSFTSEWYDGTGWNTIENLSSGFTPWQVVSQIGLPAGADHNPNFRIRFRVNAGSDYGYVDSVVVEGAPDTLGYGDWAVEQGLGVNDAYDDDPDGDGMVNLVEYAIGANSLSNDAAFYRPHATSSKQNGTNYLNLVYRRRMDAPYRGLDYQVGSATNLLEERTNATQEAGAVALGDGFELVTNRIPTDVEVQQFMELRISAD